MQVDSNPCEQMPQSFNLQQVDDNVSCSQNLTFVQDKQHLESVLGQSHETWFEELTVHQIQCRKYNGVNSVWSVIDSPTHSPTISQLIHNQLTIGSSPVGLRHSSPLPYCEHEENFNAQLRTPHSGDWEKPLLGLSPGLSPIIQSNSNLYHPDSSGVYSLGVDDSALLWTNSLATPPRDPSLTDSLDTDIKMSPSKTKDTARALFSPGSKLDTTGESLLPIDSTFEEDQSDMDVSQSNLQQANQNVNQAEYETSLDQTKMPISNNPEILDIPIKADSVKEKFTETKHMENWKVNFKNRLISRKESSTESSKKFKSKNRNNPTVYLKDEENNHMQNGDKENTSSYYGSTEQLTSVLTDIEDSSMSPTFSQNNTLNWSKSKSKKSPTVSSRYKCSSVDDVLSDFFDPPSASVGRRKPAPSRKRKSRELEESAIFQSSTVALHEGSDCRYSVSTPIVILQSILSSNKKQIGSSCKKVRFSDNVQKYSFIPDQGSNLKKCDGTETSSKRRCLIKKVQFEEVVLAFKSELHNESPSDKESIGEYVHSVHGTEDQDATKDSDVLTKVNSTRCIDGKSERNENGCRKVPTQISTLTTTKSNVLNKKNVKKQLSKVKNRKPENCLGFQSYARNSRKIEEDGPKSPVRKLPDDRQGDELFSQVSPSALDEMCDVAEQSIPNVCTARTAKMQSNDNSHVKPAKTLVIKKFCYPSDSQISTACSAKVFEYNERGQKDKKVLLKSIHLEEIVNKYSQKLSGNGEKKEEAGSVEELVEGTNRYINQTYNTEQNITNHVMCETESKPMPAENHSERKMLSMNKKNLEEFTTSLTSYPGNQSSSSHAELPTDASTSNHSTISRAELESTTDASNQSTSSHTVFQNVSGIGNLSTSSRVEIQSAAGRQVHIQIQPLDQEATVVNMPVEHKSTSLGSHYCPVMISSVIGSESTDNLPEKSISLRNNISGAFKTASGKTVSLPDQALLKAKHLLSEENLEEKGVEKRKPSNITSNVLGKTNEKPQNNVAYSIERFQSASGNALHSPTKALENATSLLCENKFETQSFAEKQYRLHRNVAKKVCNMQDENTNNLVNSGSGKSLYVPAQTFGKAVTLMHKYETQSTVVFQNLDVQQTENRANDALKGFQFASGKTLNIPAQALEKAVHLLEAEHVESVGQVNEEKRHEITLFSKDSVENIDDKNKKEALKETRTRLQDVYVDDIEFSNWGDEEMESNEDLLLESDKLDCNCSDSEINRNRQNARPSESKDTRMIKSFSKDKENRNSTATLTKGDTVEVEKANSSNEHVGKASTCLYNTIARFPTASKQKIKLDVKTKVLMKDLMYAKDADKLGTMRTRGNGDSSTSLDTHGNLKKCIQTKPQIMYETLPSSHATKRRTLSNPNMKLVAFQMASGKRVAFNEEKLKQAETLLNDTENDKRPELKLSAQLETIYKNRVMEMENKPSKSQINIIEGNIDTNKGGQNNSSIEMHQQFTDKLNVEFSMVSGTQGVLDKASAFTDKHIDDDVPDKECQSKYRKHESYENETGKLSVAERLILEFEYEQETNIAEEKRFDAEVKEPNNFQSIKIIDNQKSCNIGVGKLANSRNSSKRFPTSANVPKGFRPFKPPKVSKSARKEKYPESKSTEWGNEIDSSLKGNENVAITLNEKENTKSKRSMSERPETNLNDLCSDRSNVNTKEHMQEMYNTCGSMTSNNTVFYPDSKLKQCGTEPGCNMKHREVETVVDVSISDKKTAEKHCTTRISHGSSCSEKTQLQNDATCTFANNADIFKGISQMFDDDMEFTQIKLAEINILECSDLEALEDDGSSKFENKIVESKNTEIKTNSGSQSGNKVDSSEGGLTAKYGRGGLSNEKSEIYSVSNDQNMVSAEKCNVENKYCVGFSTASGKLLTTSHTAIQSAEQMLFKFDEGNAIQGDGEKLQLDTNICENKKDVSRAEQLEMLSFNHEIVGDTEIETKNNDLCLSANKLNMNSDTKKGVLGLTSSNNRDHFSNEKQVRCTFQTASGKPVELSNTNLKLKAARKTLDENIDEPFESMDSTAKERDLAMKMPSVYFKYSTDTNVDLTHSKSDDISVIMKAELQECPLKCLYKTANGKAVNVSETVLTDPRISMNETENIEETRKRIQFDRSNKTPWQSSDLFQTRRGNSSNILVPEKSVSALRQVAHNDTNKVDIKEVYSIDDSEEVKSLCSLPTANGMKTNVSHEVLKVASQTIDEKEANMHNVETNEQNIDVKSTNILTNNSLFQTASEKTIEISRKPSCSTDQELNEAMCVNNTCFDHVVPECSSPGRNISISISSPLQTCLAITSTDSDKHTSRVNSFDSGPGSIELHKVNELMNIFRNEGIEGVSDDDLNEDRNRFDDIKAVNEMHANTCTSSFPSISGFQTAPESKVHISKTALQHPRGIFGDNVDHHCCSVPDVSGFSAATERKVDIQEKAVKHANETLANDDQDLNEKTENCSKLTKIDSVPMFCSFNKTSGTKVHVSGTALLHAKRTLAENDESLTDRPIPCPASCRFSTTSGEKVHISENTMHHAKGKLTDNENIDTSDLTAKSIGCSRLAGIKLFNLPDKSCILSKETGKEISNKSSSISKISGISTASGTNVCLHDGALKRAQEKMANTDSCPESFSSVQMVGFRSASGTKVCVSESALDHAKKTLIDVNESNELTEYVPKPVGLRTPSTNVPASEQALRYAKETLIGDSNEKIAVVPSLCGFNAASVTKFNVSNRALYHAKETLADTESNNNDKKATSASKPCGFSTTSGNKVQISETALQHAKEILAKTDVISDKVELPAKFLGFHTALGTKVEVSERALEHAQVAQALTDEISYNTESFSKLLGFCKEDETKLKLSETALKHAKSTQALTDEISDNIGCPAKYLGFSTASGSKVEVSELALRHAKGSLAETDEISKNMDCPEQFLGFSTASGSKVKVSEAALKQAKGSLAETNEISKNLECPAKFLGFSTASGSKVKVSEAALKHANGSLAETDEMSKNMECPAKFLGFSTASGSTVKVSEAALKHAKGSLAETDELSHKIESPAHFLGFSMASGSKVHVSKAAIKHAKGSLADTDEISKNMECPEQFLGFSMASGSKVKVSEAALKHAKGSLAETDELSHKIESPANFLGFSTASGSKVHVSKAAIKHAKGSLADTDEISKNMECPEQFLGFSTASGSNVKVSEAALKHAKGSLAETDELTDKMDSPPKFLGFSVAPGTKVKVVEASDGALTETENISVRSRSSSKLYGFSTASGNKVNIAEAALKHTKGTEHVIDMDINERVHEPSAKVPNQTTRGILDENQANHSNRNQVEMGSMGTDRAEIYCLGTDLDETFGGFALKRRKLDMNREQRVLRNVLDEDAACRRKPVKSTPEGITTDRRHPGFRPFKPVFCKSLTTRKDRYDISTICTRHSTPTKQQSCVSSFQTPYKNIPEKTTIGSNQITPRKTDIAVKAPVFIIKSNGDVKCSSNISKQSNMINISASGDSRENSHAYNASAAETVKISNTSVDKRIESDTYANEFGESDGGENEEIDRTVGEMNTKNSNEKFAFEENKESKVTKKIAPIETIHTSEIGVFDSFSQEEDDVYYCMLVEARRHQDKLIAQRSSTRVCPVAGRLWEMKQLQGRWKLKELIDRLGQRPEKPVCVSSDISMSHVFSMEAHYSRNTAHVLVGDGAYLVPDDAGNIGKLQFYRAFLTLEGVDSKLISEAWFYNHYRWIVWKLAAYENTSSYLHSRCLTPEMLMLQIKYRYDREVDQSQRSCIKKIFERDDTPSKRMVLCVATVRRICSNSTVADQSKPDLHEKILLELTDGWYSIPAQIDGPLTQLVQQAKIRVGQKLVLTGADLIGGEDACTPLEAPASVMLKICRNSTRRAPWDSIIGYQSDPQPLCVPLSDLHCDGGAVGVVDVVIVRIYPILHMEKVEGGGCVFRTSRCEDQARQEFETRKQGEMEKVYRQIENLLDTEDKQVIKGCGHEKLSCREIDDLQCGQDIYEAMEGAAQPDMLQNYLSEHQLSMLYEYQRQLQEEKQSELNSKFQSAWQEKLETFQERVVTPVLKLRLAGCANRDLDHSTSTILTVWRPAPEILDLQEGHRYKIYGLNTSLSRSKYTGHRVQLTATKQTRFRRMQLDENILDRIYEPREVLSVSDIKRRQPPYGELDFVGIVVQVAESLYNNRACDTVYLADCQAGVLAVRFWNGCKSFGKDLFTVGSVLCCSNLIDKCSYRSPQIPTVDAAAEFTQLTKKSHNSAQRKALDRLNMLSKDRTFMEKAMSNISSATGTPGTPKKLLEVNESVSTNCVEYMPTEHICQSRTAERDNTDCKNIISDPRTELSNDASIPAEPEAGAKVMNIPPGTDISATVPAIEHKRSVSQAKMARLVSYGSPSVLSHLHTTLPRSVSKGFKPPAFKKL